MKKILFLLCSLAAAGLILSALAAGEKQQAAASSNADVQKLTQQVDSLQAKIKTLEERIAKLEKWNVMKVVTLPPLAANPSPQSTMIPGANTDPNRPPNAWSEREFNGMKYYLMPLSAGEN